MVRKGYLSPDAALCVSKVPLFYYMPLCTVLTSSRLCIPTEWGEGSGQNLGAQRQMTAVMKH